MLANQLTMLSLMLSGAAGLALVCPRSPMPLAVPSRRAVPFMQVCASASAPSLS